MKNTTKALGKRKTNSKLEKIKDDRIEYEQLCGVFPLRPIRSDEMNDRAGDVCIALANRFDDLSRAEKDYLDVLSDLIYKYELKWDDGFKMTPAELVKDLMKQNNLAQKDLIPQLGSASRVSEFLKGSRNLSVEQAKKLSDRFKLRLEAFL
jgi:HTH-type transcriptional regulator/antitoxin HigA